MLKWIASLAFSLLSLTFALFNKQTSKQQHKGGRLNRANHQYLNRKVRRLPCILQILVKKIFNKTLEMRLKLIEVIDREATTLSDFCRSVTPTKQAVMECEGLGEYQSATQIAYRTKREARDDRYKYKVSLDSIAQTVTVSLTPP